MLFYEVSSSDSTTHCLFPFSLRVKCGNEPLLFVGDSGLLQAFGLEKRVIPLFREHWATELNWSYICSLKVTWVDGSFSINPRSSVLVQKKKMMKGLSLDSVLSAFHEEHCQKIWFAINVRRPLNFSIQESGEGWKESNFTLILGLDLNNIESCVTFVVWFVALYGACFDAWIPLKFCLPLFQHAFKMGNISKRSNIKLLFNSTFT